MWRVRLHTHRSLYFTLCCCCCSIFASISLPCPVPTAPSPRHFVCPAPLPSRLPPLMTVPFTPLGKSVISPSRWVCVPSDQLINYILVQLCSAFFDAKSPPSLHTHCSSPRWPRHRSSIWAAKAFLPIGSLQWSAGAFCGSHWIPSLPGEQQSIPVFLMPRAQVVWFVA